MKVKHKAPPLKLIDRIEIAIPYVAALLIGVMVASMMIFGPKL